MEKRNIRHELRNWDDIRFFLAVYQGGSFAQAAEILKTDQSTVGRRIAGLEQYLGAKLFDRRGNGMRPTPTAHGLIDNARAIGEAVSSIERRFGGIDAQLTGVVKIAATEGLAAGWLTPRLANLHVLNPEILIEMVTGNEAADLAAREADVAIRLARPSDPKLVLQKVGIMRFGLFAAPSYASTFGIPATLEELLDHRIVDHSGLVGRPMQPWRDIVARHKLVTYRTNSSAVYHFAVETGYGLGLLPQYTGMMFPELIKAPIDIKISTSIWLVSHEDSNQVARTRAVIEYIRDLFNKDRAAWFS